MTKFDLDDVSANPSTAIRFNEVVDHVSSRRRFLKTGAGVGALGFLGLGATKAFAAPDEPSRVAKQISLAFEAVAPNTEDAITLPSGYRSQVINRWGDPLFSYSPAFKGDATDGGEAQAMQVGYNHDGMHFFPIDGVKGKAGSSTEGLMVTNHEYITPHYFFPKDVVPGQSNWNEDWVRKSQHAQGASVVHMRLNAQKQWEPVLDSLFNRSINANTPMAVVGPAAGHALMRTKADLSGKLVLGTFGNCGNGYTLWNTYLSCEENFTDYFGVGEADPAKAEFIDEDHQAHQQRYKGSSKAADDSYRWDTHDTRFDWTQEPNEANRFGWIIEIDPFDPHSAPKKLTALGRFKHENAAMTLADDNRVVVYMGDDQRSEYIYKFVSKRQFNVDTPAENRLLLDEGTLYVAQFSSQASAEDADGVGKWIPLVLDTPTVEGKKLGDLFESMGELLIKTRQAADAVGATPMDRPEWVAVHPVTREAYVTLTNNSDRGRDKERWPGGLTHPGVDGANPRVENHYGQIVRWREAKGDPAALTFDWDIFVLAGNPNLYNDSDPRRGSDNINKGNTFNSPDGLAFDAAGRLWIQTDGNYSNSGVYEGQGNNSMLIADPVSKEIRRFLVGPKGCEVTGITWTPDQRYAFINIQHPGEGPDIANSQSDPTAVSTWPDGKEATRPRPATVVIWREDGGVVGT
ncbi:PhoX family phosphatase [Paenalcaligenes niemegkensis]|uniref:PhoX family protein n=1 Tax=Paenalcaligenes niemegkensis TaxID=2895469 RepID=UPI001EE96F90|nr:PhoX family phosphatase [Paenalcaligenes niemegkensis]MCQ9616702.1 PhoX family phosphatase [Paenalcaligenes niemegkensis]